jgi:hypothetical protein
MSLGSMSRGCRVAMAIPPGDSLSEGWGLGSWTPGVWFETERGSQRTGGDAVRDACGASSEHGGPWFVRGGTRVRRRGVVLETCGALASRASGVAVNAWGCGSSRVDRRNERVDRGFGRARGGFGRGRDRDEACNWCQRGLPGWIRAARLGHGQRPPISGTLHASARTSRSRSYQRAAQVRGHALTTWKGAGGCSGAGGGAGRVAGCSAISIRRGMAGCVGRGGGRRAGVMAAPNGKWAGDFRAF